MKRKLLSKAALIVAMAVCLISITSCNTNITSEATDGKPIVYTSFYAMYDFTTKIAGDKINVQNLISPGTESHHWEPSAADIIKLEKAQALIINGAGFEGWAEKLVNSLNNDIMVVDTSKGVDLILLDEDHTHEEEHDEDHDEHDDFDPHIWTSLRNAVIQLENIKNALSEIDKENASYYNDTYELWKTKFLAADNEFSAAVSSFKQKKFVVSHNAFSYLAKDYGLEQISLRGISAESEPDAGTLAEIVKTIRDNDIKTIFYEEFINPKVSQTVANETGAELSVLSPAETLSDEQIKNGEDYLSVMKNNFEKLKKALG